MREVPCGASRWDPSGGTRPLSDSDVKLPAVMEMANAVYPQDFPESARRVTVVEALKTALRTLLAGLGALFAILQHCAFRWKL